MRLCLPLGSILEPLGSILELHDYSCFPGNDCNTIETFLKAVGSLQRCINIKIPTLRFDFEMLILLFHFNHDI